MNFEEVNAYLKTFVDFERRSERTYDERFFNLMKMKGFLKASGIDPSPLKYFHVAGSKGKGTTCGILADYLYKKGFKVGLYTSPHMFSVCERFQINGQMMPEDVFVKYVEDLKPKMEKYRSEDLTFFEIITAIAFKYFIDEKVDYVVLEVGLGGRLDATNVIEKSEISVITAIEKEHTDVLGDKLSQIVKEKLGIIKEGCPVLVGYQSEEAEKLIRKQLEGREDVYFVEEKVDLDKANLAKWKNGQLAYNATEIVLGSVDRDLFAEVFNEFRLSGRMEEYVIEGKDVLFDMAHTVSSIRNLIEFVKDKHPVFLFSVMKDKKVDEILSLFPDVAEKVFFTSSHPDRGMDPVKLQELYQGNSEVVKDCHAAFKLALEALKKDQVLVVTGSHFLVGEILKKIKQ